MRALPAPLKLWLLLLCGFVVLSVFAAAYHRFPGDLWVSHRLQEIGSPFGDIVSLPEALADLPFVLAVWLPALVLLWLLHRRREAVLLLVTPIGSAINTTVKALVDRPRPSPDLVRVTDHPTGPAFPSGHTVSAVIIFGLLFYFTTTMVRPLWLRLPLQLACIYGIAFTGLARIYHGAHWFSDVYGAAILGGLLLAVLIALHRHLSPTPAAVTSDPRPRY